MYALAVMIGSLVVGKLLTRFGRKFILIFGLTMMGCSMFCFGFITYIESHVVLIIVWLIIRAIQGCSSSMIQTTSYAIVAITFPEEQQRYLGFLEASMGVGLLVGPVAGSILYSTLGFKATFFWIGVTFISLAPLLRFVIPKSVDDHDISSLSGIENSMSLVRSFSLDPGPRTIKYSELFSRKVFVFTAVAAFFSYFQSWYLEPVLALRITEFGVSSLFIGFFFALSPITYVMVSANISWFTDRFDNKVLIYWGLVLWGISQFLVGPSMILPNSLWIMCVGQLLMGGFSVFFLITCLPEMIRDAVEGHPHKKLEATDISAGVFNCMLGSGQMLGPIYGSLIKNHFSFRVLTDSVAWMLLCFGLAYFITWDGYYAFKHSRIFKNDDILQRLKSGEFELSSNISFEEWLRIRKDSSVV